MVMFQFAKCKRLPEDQASGRGKIQWNSFWWIFQDLPFSHNRRLAMRYMEWRIPSPSLMLKKRFSYRFEWSQVGLLVLLQSGDEDKNQLPYRRITPFAAVVTQSISFSLYKNSSVFVAIDEISMLKFSIHLFQHFSSEIRPKNPHLFRWKTPFFHRWSHGKLGAGRAMNLGSRRSERTRTFRVSEIAMATQATQATHGRGRGSEVLRRGEVWGILYHTGWGPIVS